jgi:ribosomal protein L16 Arg81 hydroxylase
VKLKTLDNIKRIEHASRADLERFIFEQRPVIITGLFTDQPIREIASADDAVARLGGMPMAIRPEYSFNDFEAYRAGPRARQTEMTLAEYMEFKRLHADTPLLCLEEATPDAVLSLFALGEYGEINAGQGDRIVSRLFVGNTGNRSNLHYDCDYHAALLYQVFGRKRVILIPPRESQKLRPVMNFSEYLLYNFSPEDKDAFIRYTNAYDAVLHPGEALLIPTAFWHHVEYVDDSMSFDVKLRRNRYLRLLGGGLFHSNYIVQGLATKFIDGAAADAEHVDTFDRILTIYTDRALDPFAKFEALDELFRELYRTVCPDFPQGPYFSSMPGVRESDLWRERLENGSLYGDPGAITSGAARATRSR